MEANAFNRRNFLRTLSGAAGLLLATPVVNSLAQAAPVGGIPTISKMIKVGLVGCGGRGLGAIKDALDADPNVVVWSLGDVFPERIGFSIDLLIKQFGPRVQVDKSRQFVGLDSYQGVIGSDIDVVLLCTPPAFRPEQLSAAVAANKHIYAEKPMAVDVPGILSVMETAKVAKDKNIIILDGFCWRYDPANVEAHQKLRNGDLGKVLGFDGVYFTSPPKSPLALDSRPAGESDVSWALRNWTAWYWLSGGQLVEQIVHTIDGMVWSMGDRMPIAASGTGGRAQRTDDGDVWDHYDIRFEYDHEALGHISCRQWVGCHGQIEDKTYCEKGLLVTPNRPKIESVERWRFRGERGNMYANTHVQFYQFLKDNKYVQTLDEAAQKTLVAIMGREAAHTGQRITWDQILKNNRRLVPEKLTMETSLPPARIPRPGRFA